MATHAANPSYILVQVKRFEGFKMEQAELGRGGYSTRYRRALMMIQIGGLGHEKMVADGQNMKLVTFALRKLSQKNEEGDKIFSSPSPDPHAFPFPLLLRIPLPPFPYSFVSGNLATRRVSAYVKAQRRTANLMKPRELHVRTRGKYSHSPNHMPKRRVFAAPTDSTALKLAP